MLREKNEVIAVKCFASLGLDYEFSDYVSCRVLIDGWYDCGLIATSRDEAIEKFLSGKYKEQ